jgi:hypothetical protein
LVTQQIPILGKTYQNIPSGNVENPELKGEKYTAMVSAIYWQYWGTLKST